MESRQKRYALENPHKDAMIKRIEYEVLKMREYARSKKMSNEDIANRVGLKPSSVWRFLNRTSPEMSMITFLLVAKGIGYDFDFKK